MKKILFVVTNADCAGAPLHVFELIGSLLSAGHIFEVVFGENGEVKNRIDSMGIKTHIISRMRSNINPIDDFSSCLKLIEIIKTFQPDIIHCHSSKAGMVGRIAGLLTRTKVLFTVHGWGFGPGRRLSVSIIVRTIEFFLRFITDHYIAVSDADRVIGIKALGINPSKITTVHNGVSFVQSPILQDRMKGRIIMVARNDFPKDYMTLCRALAKADFSEAFFVGFGTDSSEFVEQANILLGNASGKVRFLGFRSDVSDLLSQSSIFVLSSGFEGLPLSIIEAMSHGMPVISSDVGGCSELVRDGFNGYLFKSGDHIRLSECISTLCGSDEICKEFGINSRKIYEDNFSADLMKNKTLAVYSNIFGDV